MVTVNIIAIDGLKTLFARPAFASNRMITFHAVIAVRDRFTRSAFLAVSQTLRQRKPALHRKQLGILHIWCFHELSELNAKRRQEQTMYR